MRLAWLCICALALAIWRAWTAEQLTGWLDGARERNGLAQGSQQND